MRISVISRDFSAFCWMFCLPSSAGKTVETTTNRRNSSIIGSKDTYFIKEMDEKETKMNLFYFNTPVYSKSHEN